MGRVGRAGVGFTLGVGEDEVPVPELLMNGMCDPFIQVWQSPKTISWGNCGFPHASAPPHATGLSPFQPAHPVPLIASLADGGQPLWDVAQWGAVSVPHQMLLSSSREWGVWPRNRQPPCREPPVAGDGSSLASVFSVSSPVHWLWMTRVITRLSSPPAAARIE